MTWVEAQQALRVDDRLRVAGRAGGQQELADRVRRQRRPRRPRSGRDGVSSNSESGVAPAPAAVRSPAISRSRARARAPARGVGDRVLGEDKARRHQVDDALQLAEICEINE